MGLTLACWKWATEFATANPKEVFLSLIDDRPHAAVGRFDISQFEQSLRRAMHIENELPFEWSPADFKGNHCNWLILSAGYDDVARFLVDVVRVASSQGVVVFHEELGRLVGLRDAEAFAEDWAERHRAIEGIRDRYDEVVAKYLVPGIRQLGFQLSDGTYSKADGDRNCAISPIFQPGGGGYARVNLSIRFLSLLKFQNEYRAFCQEQPITTDSFWHIQSSLPNNKPGEPPLLWSLSGGRSASDLGKEISVAVQVEATSLFGRVRTLNDLAREWETRQAPPFREIASVYWLLGDQSIALQMLERWDAALDAVLQTRHHPPSRSRKVELRFFRDFLNSRK
ncbi:MAG: hypothetical protein ABSH08_11395 [Tepidisphaeraceae bacterium]|jgi:hypothetical protein